MQHDLNFYLLFGTLFVAALLADLAARHLRLRHRAAMRCRGAPADIRAMEDRIRQLEAVVAEPEYELRQQFRRL